MEVGIRFPGHTSYLWFPEDLKEKKKKNLKSKPKNYSSCILLDVILWPHALRSTIKPLVSWKEIILANTQGLNRTGQKKEEGRREEPGGRLQTVFLAGLPHSWRRSELEASSPWNQPVSNFGCGESRWQCLFSHFLSQLWNSRLLNLTLRRSSWSKRLAPSESVGGAVFHSTVSGHNLSAPQKSAVPLHFS